MAISVELGPGMRLAAPKRSRNCSRVSHCRRRTVSSSIIAMCAAGPPNAVKPSRRNSSATSRSRARSGTPAQPRVERELTGAREGKHRAGEQHGEVHSRLVRHRAEARLREHRQLGGGDGDEHVDDQRNSSEACHQADDEQSAADDLDNSHEWREQLWRGNADLHEPPDAERVGKEKLLYAFREEDAACREPSEKERFHRGVNWSRSAIPNCSSSFATCATAPSKPSWPSFFFSSSSNCSPSSRYAFSPSRSWNAGKSTVSSRAACGRYMRLKMRSSSASFLSSQLSLSLSMFAVTVRPASCWRRKVAVSSVSFFAFSMGGKMKFSSSLS